MAQQKFADDDGDWDDIKIPKPVVEAVEAYGKARKAASKAAQRKRETMTAARELMDKHEIDKAPFVDENGNRCWIYRFDKPELKSRRVVEPKKPKDEE